eukprot:scaffold3428_cov379-Prasinococcus_capsulatus_cf.AAC.8
MRHGLAGAMCPLLRALAVPWVARTTERSRAGLFRSPQRYSEALVLPAGRIAPAALALPSEQRFRNYHHEANVPAP